MMIEMKMMMIVMDEVDGDDSGGGGGGGVVVVMPTFPHFKVIYMFTYVFHILSTLLKIWWYM